MAIYHRKYKNYKEYLKHQKRKLDIGLEKKIKKFMPDSFQKIAEELKYLRNT